MQQGPTLQDIEIQYHDFTSSQTACFAQIMRGYKETNFRLSQELRLKTIEIQKLRDKYEPKKDEKPKKT